MKKEKEKYNKKRSLNESPLELVRIMGSISCPILKYGWKKISMDYYYCKTCDKDNKNPICVNCMKKCHKNHIPSQLFPANDQTKTLCMCGLRAHSMLNEETSSDKNFLVCKFFEFNIKAEIYEYYENTNGIKICTFCNHFCKEENVEEKQFTLFFKKRVVSKEEFITNINSKVLECQCPKLPGSKHHSSHYFSEFVSNINIPNKNYFPLLTSLHMLNFLLDTKELMAYIYITINTENLLRFNSELEKKTTIKDISISALNISTTIKDLSNLSQNISHCSHFYYSPKMQVYFNPKIANELLCSKNLKKKKVYDFFGKYLLCYKNVHLKQIFNHIAPYSMYDIINLSPFQRLMYYLNCKSVYKQNESIIDNLILFIETLVKNRPKLSESFSLFPELFSLIKFYSSRYLLSFEQIGKIVRNLDDYFYYILLSKSADKTELVDAESRKIKIKTMSLIYKILLYISYYYNDSNVINYLVSKEKKEFPFIHTHSELGRNLLKVLTHLLNYVREELAGLEERIKNTKNKVMSQKTNSFRNDNKYRDNLIDMVSKTEMLVFIGIQDEDIYLTTLRRSINVNLDNMIVLSNEKTNMEKISFFKFLSSQVEKIEVEYFKYYQTPNTKDNLKKIIISVEESIGEFFNKMDIDNVELPEYNDNAIEFSFELNNDEDELKEVDTEIKQKFTRIFTKTKTKIRKDTIKDPIKKQQTYMPKEVSYQLILARSNYSFCITKVFTITKDKAEFDPFFCKKILKILYILIDSSPENVLIGLSSPILRNLSKLPREYYDKVLDYIIEGMRLLINTHNEIGSLHEILKYSVKIYTKTTIESKRNCGTSLKNTMSCLLRLIKIMILGYSINIYEKNKYLTMTQKIIEDLLNKNDFFSKYKSYIFEIRNDFDRNRKAYYDKRDYNNELIFNQIFMSEINLTNGSFQTGIAFNIFVSFIKLVNLAFDGNALSTIPSFIFGFLNQKEIIEMLQVKTLNIVLRLELLTFFRMAYIDMLIDTDKMQNYRNEFQNDLDQKVNQLGDSLLPTEQLKIFVFLEMLMKVSKSDPAALMSTNENDILLYEISNIDDIINYSKFIDDPRIYTAYFENGILLPIKIYLNKTFSLIMSINGKEFLKIYKFAFYILMMKRFLLKKNIFNQEIMAQDNNHHNNTDSNNSDEDNTISQQLDIKNSQLIEVETDLKKITSPTFQPLNYLIIFEIITKHIMSLIEHPTSKQLVMYFNNNELYGENKKNILKALLLKKKIDVDNANRNYSKLWKIYEFYIEQKSNFKNSAIRSILDENYSENEDTYRSVLLKFLFYLSTQKFGIYSDSSIQIILNLLKAETTKTQKSVLEILSKSKQQIVSRIENYNSSSITVVQKQNNIIDFSYFAESGFKFILSTIFAQYNPTSLEISDDYYNACHIIKLFKFLCEEHNNDFQTIFLKKLYFSINDMQKITYYDMMLFVLEKIIILSSWEKAKSEEEVQDYFYGLFSCIIEMLIEMVQGTEQNNFNNLIRTKRVKKFKYFGNAFDNDEDPILYENGKALKSFLNNIKALMFNDFSDSETIFSIRKNLMEFLLAFIEEYNCPKEIKQMIMSSYHPSSIIKSICIVMKKYYITMMENKNELNKDKDSFMYEDTKFRKKTTNMILENNLHTSHTVVNNDTDINQRREAMLKSTKQKKTDKKLKRLKFNKTICEELLKIYFDDEEFFSSQAFDLCSSFFTFFSLTELQYKNEESIDFLNKITSINKDALDDFNTRTDYSHKSAFYSSSSENATTRDDFEFEAYYVIKFFREISKNVIVKVKENKPPIYVVYTMMPYLMYLSTDTKNEFIQHVNRKNRNTKLVDLMEQSEFFRLEIEYNWKHLRTNKFIRKLTDVNYRYIGYFLFIASIMTNIILLFTLDSSDNDNQGELDVHLKAVKIISFTMCAISIMVILLWLMTKMELRYQIEKAKYTERNNRKNKPLTVLDKIYIRYNAIRKKGELSPFLYYIICTVIAISSRKTIFFHSFSLFIIVFLSQTLKNLALSLFVKGRQFMWTSLFTFVLLYVFAGWGFYFQRDRFYDTVNRLKPDQMCDSLLYCFLTEINNGLRWHLGIGKVLLNESGVKHPGPFIHRFFYDFVFYLLNYTMMLHIVFGIVIDSFRELRKKNFNIEKDIKNKCFICDLDKDTCEKNNKNFKEHCEKEHFIWDYAYYMITLRMKDVQDLNAVNSRCKELISDKQIQWLPDADKGVDDNDEESEDNLEGGKISEEESQEENDNNEEDDEGDWEDIVVNDE